jgi:hypothetical protein
MKLKLWHILWNMSNFINRKDCTHRWTTNPLKGMKNCATKDVH